MLRDGRWEEREEVVHEVDPDAQVVLPLVAPSESESSG